MKIRPLTIPRYLEQIAKHSTPNVTFRGVGSEKKHKLIPKLGRSSRVKNKKDPEREERYILKLFRQRSLLSPLSPRDVTALVLKANQAGKGGRFRTFQTHLKEIMQQKLAFPSPSSPATPPAQ
jgi:hypothetical protein